MPQSLSKIYLHVIFSTKNREPWLTDKTRQPLYNYMAGILKNHGASALEIGGVQDHVHLLLVHSRTLTVADLIRDVKSSSTKWLKVDRGLIDFGWQSGYGAFSVSHSDVGQVRNYIQRQEAHHKARTFQDEYREFLKRYEVEFDERYVWD